MGTQLKVPLRPVNNSQPQMHLLQVLALVPLVAGSKIASRASMPTRMTAPVRRSLSSRLNKVVARSDVEAPAEPATPEPEIKQPWKLAAGTAPMGPYFDPLGFTKGKSESELKRFREAEVTHSRVAMLAMLGFMFQEALLDRPLFFKEGLGAIEGPAIYHFQEVSERFPLFWLATIPFFAFHENLRARKGWQDPTKGGDLFGMKDDYEPGDLNFDPFGAYPIDSKGQQAMKNKELNNGRLAMLGVAGLAAQELIDGKTLWQDLHVTDMMPPHGPV